MNRTNILLFTALLLFATSPLLAQDPEVETGAVIKQGTTERITFLEENVLPAIANMIRSLVVQNAPVPLELNAIRKDGSDLRTRRDIARFEEKARRYFGDKWETQLVENGLSMR